LEEQVQQYAELYISKVHFFSNRS